MSEYLVHQALVDSFTATGIPQLNIAFEQREFKPPADNAAIWFALQNMPASRAPNTLGKNGEDEYLGVFQIDVSGPQGQGVRPVLEAAGEIVSYYTAGKSFSKDAQVVRIRRAELSQPRRDGVRLVCTISVYWSAAFTRPSIV